MFRHDSADRLRPRLLVAATLAALALPAAADQSYCFDTAAQAYGVDADVLRAIAWRESRFLTWKVHRNSDGSVDYGLMQINSRNLGALGLDVDTVMDPCENIVAGARLYRRQIDHYGNTWNAVGAYHSATPALRDRYADDVRRDWHAIRWLRDRWHALQYAGARLRSLFGAGND